MMKRSQEPRCMTAGSHLKKAEDSLKTCEVCTFRRESYGQCFLWGFSWHLIHRFSNKQRIIKAAYYSKLLKDQVKSVALSKRRGRSVKSVCLLHHNARPYTAAVTTETLEEMHPACSSDLVSSDFDLFGPLKQTTDPRKKNIQSRQ